MDFVALAFLLPLCAGAFGVWLFIFWVITLIQLLQRDDKDKTAWVFTVILLSFVGALLYRLIKLKDKNDPLLIITLLSLAIPFFFFCLLPAIQPRVVTPTFTPPSNIFTQIASTNSSINITNTVIGATRKANADALTQAAQTLSALEKLLAPSSTS